MIEVMIFIGTVVIVTSFCFVASRHKIISGA